MDNLYNSSSTCMNELESTMYGAISRCIWNFHYGLASRQCKGFEVVERLIQTRVGKVCCVCFPKIPLEFRM